MQDPSRKAKAAALRLLAIRDRSVSEMKNRLELRFGMEQAEKTVSKLESQGLLNDAAFANRWRERRETRRPLGAAMIKRELRQRGVAETTIEAELEDFDASAAAYRAAAKYAERQTKHGKAAFDRRVGAFLGRRGFETETIRGTLRRLHAELDLHEDFRSSSPAPKSHRAT